jgi:hypothetical protein
MSQRFFTRKVRFHHVPLLALSFILTFPFAALSQHSPKIPFPYGPMGLNSMPWIVAKESNLFAKNGLDVDMIFVGVSTVMVQSMLSGFRQCRRPWRTGGHCQRFERRRYYPGCGDGTLFHSVPDGAATDYGDGRPKRKKSRDHQIWSRD